MLSLHIQNFGEASFTTFASFDPATVRLELVAALGRGKLVRLVGLPTPRAPKPRKVLGKAQAISQSHPSVLAGAR